MARPIDDGLEMPPVPDGRLWWWMGRLGAATGALAGGIEALGLGVTLRLPMSSGEMAVLALLTVFIDAVLGLGAGLGAGLVGQLLPPPRWRRYQAAFTLTSLGIAAFFLLPLTRELWLADRRAPAAGMLALIALIGALGYFNGGYWFRRLLIGAGPRFGWQLLGPAAAGVLVVLAVGLSGPASPKGAPPEGSPNLVLVSIDTLRRDHLGFHGSTVRTPRLDAFAAGGVIFDDAVAPLPETLPSHASMLTGLQPMQHGILSNGMPLRSGFITVPEHLSATGYRTGAFVSSFAVDGSTGIDQGFQVYDDDFFPLGRGISQVRLAGVALPLLMRFGNPSHYPFLLERGSPETIRRALRWAEEPSDRPIFLWVHLFDPHSPYERHDGQPNPVDHRRILELEPGYDYQDGEEEALRALYRHEVEYTDEMVDLLLTGLRERGLLDDAMVVFVSDHGESLGEHDIMFNHHGVYEEVLRVPLVVWTSDGQATPGARVSRMVNVGDIANTLVQHSTQPLLSRTNSIPLLSFVRGDQVPERPLLVQGREGASLTQGQLCGIRSPNRVKYIRHQDGVEEVYDLTADPQEAVNLAAKQPRVLENGRQGVAECAGTTVVAGGDAATNAMLEALGYVQGDE